LMERVKRFPRQRKLRRKDLLFSSKMGLAMGLSPEGLTFAAEGVQFSPLAPIFDAV
jgi:hypothetical protein